MKGNAFAITLAVVVVGLGLLLFFAGKNDFDWDTNFQSDSTEPFGTELFDRVVESACGTDGYRVSMRSLGDVLSDTTDSPHALLIIALDVHPDSATMAAMTQLLQRGYDVMLTSGDVDEEIADTFGLRYGYHYWTNFDKFGVSREDTVETQWLGTKVTPAFTTHCIDGFLAPIDREEESDKRQEALIFTDDNVNAWRIGYGQGNFFFVGCPYLFTNYAVLHPELRQLTMALLSELRGPQIERVVPSADFHTGDDLYSQSDATDLLGYIMQFRPLKWAWWIAVIVIILFMITTARRRQRIIPVVQPPQNSNLDFILLIGSLYHQRGDHLDLVHKKFRYTADRLRRRLHVDITNPADDDASCHIIALDCGLPADEVRSIITTVRALPPASEATINENTMKIHIDNLTKIEGSGPNHTL